MDAFFNQALLQIDTQGQRRRRGNCLLASKPPDIDFSSNDYLGLAGNPAVAARAQAVLQTNGWGAGASAVLSGYTPLHQELEHALAAHCHTDAALVFSSGFAANVGALACLATESDVIYSDALNHASLIDGIRLSRAERTIYPHNDLEFLTTNLHANRSRFARALIVTESVFSMDGDEACLADLLDLCCRFDCGLIVDEAHATGVYGATGGGLLQALQLDQHPALVLKLGTLSKALGGIGGFAAGSAVAIEYLVNRCRSYLFSTAPPAASMAASLAALELSQGMSAARTALQTTSFELRQQLQRMGWNVPNGQSPILPLIIGDERSSVRWSEHLSEQGMRVPAIRPPTVPPGTSRLRISLSTQHTPADLANLVAVLETSVHGSP
ncbi:MAG: 8-amino-7-oxononanoate synthase [Pirellulaceae bacterium]